MKNDNTYKVTKAPQYSINHTNLESIKIDRIDGGVIDGENNKMVLRDINTEIHYEEIYDSTYHMEITMALTYCEKETEVIAFGLDITYIAFVDIENTMANKPIIQTILNKKAPSDLFKPIELVISNTIMAAIGCSVKISKNKFMKSIQDIDIKHVDINSYDKDNIDYQNTDCDNEIINYQQILKGICTMEAAREFLATYQECVGPNILDDYETSPAFKFYYRFFIPIEYHHPDIKGCDDTVWPMLYQLLFGNYDATCQIIDRGIECPEIEFSYDKYGGLVSDLSKTDLKNLLEDLVIDMLVHVSVELIGYHDINKDYGNEINPNRLVRWREFLKLYGYDDIGGFPGDGIIEKMYSRIKDCDIKTLIYR